jgi:hypothetical protein
VARDGMAQQDVEFDERPDEWPWLRSLLIAQRSSRVNQDPLPAWDFLSLERASSALASAFFSSPLPAGTPASSRSLASISRATVGLASR